MFVAWSQQLKKCRFKKNLSRFINSILHSKTMNFFPIMEFVPHLQSVADKYSDALKQGGKHLTDLTVCVGEEKPKPLIDVKFRQFITSCNLIRECESILRTKLLELRIELHELRQAYNPDEDEIGRALMRLHSYKNVYDDCLSEKNQFHVLCVLKCLLHGVFDKFSDMKNFLRFIMPSEILDDVYFNIK